MNMIQPGTLNGLPSPLLGAGGHDFTVLIGRDERLSKESKSLVLDMHTNIMEWIDSKDENYMSVALAAFTLLVSAREQGLEKYKYRQDSNSGYSHELGQVLYQYWMDQERDAIVRRIVRERTGRPASEAPARLLKSLRRQLDEELTDELNAVYVTSSLTHDVGENYHISPEEYVAYLSAHSTAFEGALAEACLRTFVGITRLKNDAGEKEPEINYMERQTSDPITAFTKVKDRQHNLGTALGSGRSGQNIQTMLDGTEAFLRRVEDLQQSLDRPFLLLEYGCFYLRDQVALYRQFYQFAWSKTDEDRAALDAAMDKLKHNYRQTWIPDAVHPMLCIVQRMDHMLNAYDQINNQPALKLNRAPVPSVLLSGDLWQPRPTA